MEDLYRILQTHPTASSTELKKCYQELALLYHPDKSKAKDKAATSEKFIAVNRAYKILSDPDLRTQYDVKWKERCLAQTFPIQETVDFEEFEEMVAENESNDVTENLVKICDVEQDSENQSKGSNSDENNCNLKGDNQGSVEDDLKHSYLNTSANEGVNDLVKDMVYTYTCRCGGSYILTEVDVKLKFDIVCCDSCSLSIQVTYDSYEDQH